MNKARHELTGPAIKEAVRKAYTEVATESAGCCGPSGTCGGTSAADTVARTAGYSDHELMEVPEGANLGAGCGNPVALASLIEGETVLDLGSGAGFDCFLAALRVGDGGVVIGVDFTPEMVERARGNAAKGDYSNVEFRLGDIEDIPVADCSVDIVISNCVINLAPDKGRVLREAFRVLKPGGRLSVSDMLRLREIPNSFKSSIEAYASCLPGAITREEYREALIEAGFEDISITGDAPLPPGLVFDEPFADAVIENLNAKPQELVEIAQSVVSVDVGAVKPTKNDS